MLIQRKIRTADIVLDCSVALTEEEIFEVYQEQQNRFDIQDIEKVLDEINDADGTVYGMIRSKISEKLIKRMATEMRRLQDEEPMDWYGAATEAIRKTIEVSVEGKPVHECIYSNH